ncbi:MAG TPA: hypothetical protein DIS62_00645 [Candidatus Kerfeldbacteria bacterium]|nr:hypothetical protein [Candidatus Kerfeldbacteria bacterium]
MERAFEDAKGDCGTVDYQVTGWPAWHHHTALVMAALMFLAKEGMANREIAELPSCNDLVEIMRRKLPSKNPNQRRPRPVHRGPPSTTTARQGFRLQKTTIVLSALVCDEI